MYVPISHLQVSCLFINSEYFVCNLKDIDKIGRKYKEMELYDDCHLK